MDLLKIYFLLKMGIFHCYVSLPEGIYLYLYVYGSGKCGMMMMMMMMIVSIILRGFFIQNASTLGR